MNETKLLPCPFCGGDPELVDNRVEWFVRCSNCKPFATVIYGNSVRHIDHCETDEDSAKAEQEVDWGALKQSAIDAWNRRAPSNCLHQIQEPEDDIWPCVNIDVDDDGNITNAKFYAPGFPAGNHDAYPVRVPYMDEHTEAWRACVNELEKHVPGFMCLSNMNGIECAVAAIRLLSERAKNKEPSAAEQAAWHAGLDEGRAQAAPAALAVPDGRSDFEAWATLSGYEGFERAMRGEGHYLSIALEELWQSWSESRAALVATPAEPESVVQLHPARAGRVYVAGPMTGLADFNFPAFNAAAAALRAKGWHVENPAEHGIVDGAEWADYLHYDLGRLATCAAIYLLPGWSQSRGATLEVHVGTTLGMTLFYAEGAEIYRQPIAAAAPVVLPEPDAVIREMMGLVDEWGMESHLRGEAELDAQHSEATQEEIDCAKDRASKERAAWKAIESKLRALLATGGQAQAVERGEVLVTVSGFTGSGKSAIAGEIEILCRALGLQVEWPDGDSEKNMTHADWTAALEQYKPRVHIVEQNIPFAAMKGMSK